MTGLYVASNSTALGAQFALTNNISDLGTTLTRLSTGLKINSGKDDPAGLIASELLKAEITGTSKAITNTQRANSMISTADSAMGQISNLLNDVKGLVVEAANTGAMSADQIKANQLQVDASLQAIDRIAQSTTYAGNKLLDGSMDFSTSLCSGNNSGISNLQINSANFGNADKIDVNVNVTEAAKKGTLIYNGSGVDEKTTIDITGSTGTKSFTFGAGTSTADMAAAIAASSDSTGVTAYVEGAASRGTVTLNGTGSNNGIVITSNEEGAAAGNYSFKIVSGDSNGVRVASEPTNGSSGVIEIMLQQSFNKSYKGVGGILDVSINGTSDADASGVSIKKGTTNQAVYHTSDTNASGVTQDGQKTISVVGGTAVAYSDMSKLNGWTFKVATNGDVINGQTLAADGVIYDDEAKVAYLSNTGLTADTAQTSLLTAVGRITGTTGLADTDDLAVTGLLAVGDSFKLSGGGAEGELELTYKEGATVNDILKLANNAGGNVSASLASGVNGSALVADILSGNSRMFTASAAGAMSASRTTSSVTANEVISMINSQLGDKFTATLLSGDTGTGLMTYMDAAVDSGSVNSDNAIRFTGMDDGPIVRMVTTNADGTAITNQKLSVTLLNPTEADIANGIHTQVLQINLATDSAGNSITTAQDIVDLFNSLTPEQTGGISASLILPDGVDPNGRTWYTDECGNVQEVTDCNATYGKGIVQPTGVPGPCDIQQNDLVLLGTNQTLADDYAVARIGSISSNAATNNISVAGSVGDGDNSIETTSNHSGLAGVKISFTTDLNQAGFNEADGTLMVYASPETQAATDATDPDLETLLTNAVNGAIAQNWQGIRQFNGATGNATTVALTVDDDNFADALAAFNDLDAFIGSGDTGVDANNIRGINATDPAMTITALDKGTGMAGIQIVLQHDETMAEATFAANATTINEIDVNYDATNGILTIKTNGFTDDGNEGISAQALMAALNDNATFKQYFSADATTILTAADPTGVDADYGTIYFGSGTTSAAATTTGGYKIVTAEKATGVNNDAETSAGIGMTGGSDDNQRLVIQAVDAGSENFVKVSVAEGSFRTFCPLGYEMCELAGTDVVATINGIAATGRGNNISINTTDLAMSMDVTGDVGTSSFSITGGGALFQLGANVVSAQQMRIGIGSMMTTQLGGASGKLFQLKTGGDADLITSDASRVLADKIVNEAINTVATTRGRLGAIQKSSLDPNIAVLQDTLVALTESEASYSNADFAEESSNLTRLQLLVQSGMSTLGIANQLPQYAASLVR